MLNRLPKSSVLAEARQNTEVRFVASKHAELPPSQAEVESKPGTYILMFRSCASERLRVGHWGLLRISPGYYLYVGSAFGPGGVSARVTRHWRKHKSKHWHVDYLRENTSLVSVWYSHFPERLEHRWSAVLEAMKGANPIKGFGCSDCSCKSHLYYFDGLPDFEKFARAAGVPVNIWRKRH